MARASRSRRDRGPPEQRQADLLLPECPSCFGTGRVPWACQASELVNYYRLRKGLKPLKGCRLSRIEFTSCAACAGTGKQGGRLQHPPSHRGFF